MSFFESKIAKLRSHQNIFGYILVGFSFLLLTLITVKTFAPEVKSEAANQTASQTVGPYTMSMSNDSVTNISIVPTASQQIYSASNNLSVINTCPAGASITMTTNSTSSNSLTRSATNSDTLTKDIVATTSTSLDNNSWGYALNNSSTYYAVPKKGTTSATIYNATAAQTSALTVPVKFGVKTDNNLPSGTYSNDVVYTMTPKSGCNSYSVTWNYDGGTAKSGATYPTSLSWGQTVNLSTLTPTKSGYTFAGWTNGTSTFTGSETAANLNSANAKSVTLTAQWEASCAYSNGYVWNFPYTYGAQTWTVPCDGTYKAQLWGASGGGADPGSGGDGGYISGNMSLTKDTVLYYIIGECGYATDKNDNAACAQSRLPSSRKDGSTKRATFSEYAVQGFGGNAYGNNDSIYSGSGGGATLLYLNNNYNDKTNLILVAGGGGGASDATNAAGTNYSYGGYYAGHGNNNGGSGQGTGTAAGGGTQSAGGAASSGNNATAGTYLYGGRGGDSNNAGGGGGGGYYGGGGGNENISGGGGGSSYVNTSRATQNTSETATVKVGGSQNNDGVSGEMKITYLGTSV